MKKSSPSNNPTPPSLSQDLCPVCDQSTSKELLACQVCHAEIHHLRGKKLSDAEKTEIRQLLLQVRYAHVSIICLFILSWILIRAFLWK